MSTGLILPGQENFEAIHRNAVYDWSVQNRENYDFEGSDACELALGAKAIMGAAELAVAHIEHPEWPSVRAAKVGQRVVHGGIVVAEFVGMGKIIDWRRSPWTPSSGGIISPLLYIDHIPVLPNQKGINDFIRLRDVLVAQGLMVHCSTDAEGNVAWYTDMNHLNFHARGANTISTGGENIHKSVEEEWTNRQLNAVSYMHWHMDRHWNVPPTQARLARGNGIVRVLKKGDTTHEKEADFAGFHDRGDPGRKFEQHRARVLRGVRYFNDHHHFKHFSDRELPA
jgi:hypothetical protein